MRSRLLVGNLTVVINLALASALWSSDVPAPQVDLAKDRLNRSEACGSCHAAIYEAWRDSMHARSFTDSIFQASVKQATDAHGLKVRKLCLSCHAPVALVSGDFEVKEAVTREGIGCDFCHSVKSVDLTHRPMPFEVELGGVKRGPFEYLESPAHGTAFSSLHRDSPLLCAGCHEYENSSGVAVLATYSEWKEGPYPGLGVSCQGCHMAIVPGDRVRPEVAVAQDQRLINLHRLVGGSSLSQLRRGLEASIKEATRREGTVVVKIEVHNVAAGHKVPTGLPPKQVRLLLTASQSGKEIFSDERIYARALVDETGKPLLTDADLFLNSVRVARDTRLGPRERRIERFRFPAPPGEIVLDARLLYEYKPFEADAGVRETIQEIHTIVPR
ncbi:MAG: cytochrome c family protein [Acidobacteriota bacterium]